jgi:tRNA(fMet)-specific endonuclease VapC
MHLLDTDIATLAYFGRNEKVRIRCESFPKNDTLALTIVTWAEILRGRCDALTKADGPSEWLEAELRLRMTEDWFEGFPIIGIGSAAEHLERLLKNRKLRFKGGRADMLVACIALANDATLVTRNTKDFAGIPNLKLENWAG